MQVSLDALVDLPVATETRWRDLAASAVAHNPFSETTVALTAARAVEGGRQAALLSVSDGDRLVLAAPVVRVPRYRRFPFASIATWRHAHCCSGEPLVDPIAAEEAWGAVLDHVTAERVPWLVLELVHDGGPATASLRRVLASRGRSAHAFDAHGRAVVRKREETRSADDQLSARHRSDHRRKLRGLERALGNDVVARDLLAEGADVHQVTRTFMDLEARGWKGRNGTALASSPGDAAFFERVCAQLHDESRLQMWAIGSHERNVALACNIESGDTVFRFKLAYDEEMARYSPGVQLELAMLAAFHDDGNLSVVDSCAGAGDTVYRQLYGDVRPTATLLVAPRSMAGRMVAAAAPRAATAFRRTRRAVYRGLRREPPPDYGLLD